MQPLRGRTLGNERGSVLLLGLIVVMITTFLGWVLFQLVALEASVITTDVSSTQAFYCAEAGLARVYGDAAFRDKIEKAVGTTVNFAPGQPNNLETFTTPSGSCSPAVLYNDADQSLTSTGTLTANGVQRTVQVKLNFLAPSYKYALAAALGPAMFRGAGDTGSGGRDTVIGDMFLGTNTVYLRDEVTIVPYNPSGADGPTISQPAPSIDKPSLPGFPCTASWTPCLGKTDGAPSGVPTADGQHPASELVSGAISDVKAAARSDMMTSYKGTTIYNLNAIWQNPSIPKSGGSLVAPMGWSKTDCGTYAFNTANRVYCDLRFMNIASSTSSPPTGPPGTTYYFRGLANSACPGALACDLVAASAELQQLGYAPGQSSVDVWNPTARLIVAQAGPDRPIHNINPPPCPGQCANLVDFTIFDWSSQNPDGTYAVKAPPILFADAYVRFDSGTTSLGVNGRAAIIVSQPSSGQGGSVIFFDNVYYLNGPTDTRTDLSGCARGDTSCGLADMLGLVAEKHIWYGDPAASGNSPFYDADGVMLAGGDINFYFYNSSEDNFGLKNPSGPLTVTGTVLSNGKFTMFRDWAWTDTYDGIKHFLPVRWDPNGTWVFQKLDTTTGEVSDCTTGDFRMCIPFADGNRTVSHYQMKVNYDARLRTNPELIPPGLPTGGRILTGTFTDPNTHLGSWKDCGTKPYTDPSSPCHETGS